MLSASRALFLALLAGGAAIANAAHSKPSSVEPLDAVFETGASGTIEASLDPPIQGALRIVVRARASTGHSQPGGSAGDPPPQTEHQPLTSLEVTQWERSIPYRLVRPKRRHGLFGDRSALLVADIDVNDLTPGVPVRVRILTNLSSPSNSAPPDLEAHAYAVVY